MGHLTLQSIVFASLILNVLFEYSIADTLTREPTAEALLNGAMLARNKYNKLSATVRIESGNPAVTSTYQVDLDGQKMRCQLKVDGAVREMILRDGEIYHGYRRKANEDVHIYDQNRSSGVRGDVAFDPRLLGLSDLLASDLKIEPCLWKHEWSNATVVGKEEIRGSKVWHVSIARNENTGEFWIEEPSFRIHRKRISGPNVNIVIDSEFDSKEMNWPFPSVIRCERTGEGGFTSRYIVEQFTAVTAIPAERFMLRSMDLPLNTAVVDYRINRTVGYWNGHAISEKPTYTGELANSPTAHETPMISRTMVLFIVIGVLVGLVPIIWVIRWHAGS